MKKTYSKSILHTVRAKVSRFLALFAIVALGTGFLAGILAAPVDMRLSADEYYRTADLYDIKIQATQGLTEDDLEIVRAIKGVQMVMPAWDMDLVLSSPEGESLTTRLQSIPSDTLPQEQQLNRLTLVEGRMPSAPGEIVVGLTPSFTGHLPAVGEVLTLSESENEEIVSDMLPDTFTVVGVVRSAAYFSGEIEYTSVGNGSIGLFAYTPDVSYDLDYYTTLYLTVEDAGQFNAFSDDYNQTVQLVYDRLDTIKAEREQARYDEIIGQAQSELDEAWAEYNEEKAEVETELADAEQELADGRAQLAQGEQDLANAQAQISSGQAELDAIRTEFYQKLPGYQQEIADGYAEIEEKRTQLDAAQAELNEKRAPLDPLQASKNQFWEQIAPMLGIPVLPVEQRTDEATIAAVKQAEDILAQMEPAAPVEPVDPVDPTELVDPVEPVEPEEPDEPEKPEQGGLTQEQIDALLGQLAQLKTGLSALAAQGTTLDQLMAQVNQEQAKLDETRRQLDAKYQQLQTKDQELKHTIETTEQAFADTQSRLDQARAEYSQGKADLEKARQELSDAQVEYDEARAEAEEKLTDAREEILDAESEVRKIEKGKWVLSDRTDNASFSGYADNADRISALGKVFPVFFFLVAALVALTTMTRMVEEERGQVGTLKALGYSYQQIAAKYILYASTATIAGSVVGTVIGMQLFPRIILRVYHMYDVPVQLTPFNWQFGLLATCAALACTLLATLNACWNVLREQPASLMLPKAPKAGKRIFLEYITPLWRRLKFTYKVTARNLFLYKKRFFMTVIGIAGCTALLVTGFGLHDSIADIVEKQFGEIAHYEMLISLNDESALIGMDLQAILQDSTQVTDYLAVFQEDMTVASSGSAADDKIKLMVPEDMDAMKEYFTFRQRTTGAPVTFDENAVIITEKLAELQGLSVGDAITVQNPDGDEASFTISGICENYVQHYLYTTADVYREAFGTEPTSNLLLCQLNESVNTTEAEETLSSGLLQCRDVAGVQFIRSAAESFRQNLDSVNYIVVVLIIMAGTLAFVVLYTLTDINITERTKELATIKVLGFYDNEVNAYVYRETAILTLIGTICGLVLGIFMHASVVRNAEVDIVMFDRGLYLPSFVWAALLTLLFSFLVNVVMYRKLKNISMVESMKAPE